MAGYVAEREMRGVQPLVVLRNHSGHRVRIATRGATLLNFEVPRHEPSFDIAASYHDNAGLEAHPGSRFAIMAPFAGRIGAARYRFDGHEHDLQPDVPDVERGIMHGFLRDAEFAIAELTADEHSARATLTSAAIRPRPGYPFSIDLAVGFTLDAGGLSLDARMHNVGDTAAPCFFGWHPYIRVANRKADDWLLHVPARTLIRTDADLIALPGDAAYASLDDAPELDFRGPRPIADNILDLDYVDLVADPDGRIRTRIIDPSDGFGVTVWQERGVMHVFTADTLQVGTRRAVALETTECMANAFNRPECAAAIRLEASAERSFRCGIQVAAS